MRILKFHFVLFIALSSLAFAQEVKVGQINQITGLKQGEFYYPKFSPDNSKIFFTSANYKGIWYFDLLTNKVTTVSDQDGAGYDFVFTPDGKDIIYRTFKYEGMKRIYSILSQNLLSNEITSIEADKAGLYPPQLTSSNSISYSDGSKISKAELKNAQAQLQKSSERPVVIIDNSKIVLFINGEKKILSPLGEGNYIWPSVSPDNQKLLFTFAGQGTFVSDLEGKIISKLGYANAAQWSPDGKWVIYMVDKDNGSNVTASDIFITDINGVNKIKVTDTQEVFEMYPVWSVDGKKAAFNSADGKIFTVELNID